ncbi:glutamine synthetase family protein [Hydrogenophaga sp. PAMC20947]|uniref:glutamine synthetase family protein n=1 Tax=Hydrogenophaga sp. PAMC20947 TaxID=2565558 RepID=UPI00109D90DD|nr:glutamine synthetase family protein [Hydrogenophaga sp. PAMC20947]QCB47870.1 glutamine synthetase [Hydrogenophaga sp. PAMC20947]
MNPNQDFQTAAHALGARFIECALADFSSLARGKLLSTDEWVGQAGCRLPNVLFGMTVTGGWPEHLFGDLMPKGYGDMQLVPDLSTLRARPGRPGEATVLCEPSGRWQAQSLGRELDASELSPRALLKKVVAQYAGLGLQATVAPELELFLLRREGDGVDCARARPDAPVQERSCDQYSLERMAHFEPFFDALYAGCDTLGIPLSGHLHEAARSQYEVNFRPGPALEQADAVFRFKRLAREIAARQGFLASFAAKPFLDQPGTGMHWHFSLQRPDADWPHVFAAPDGQASPELMHFIAGLQTYTPAAMALFAPYDMSFDRIALSDSSPTHADWGFDDRLAAFRIPAAHSAAAVRVENRLPGGDASPYLAVAATMAMGLAGLQEARLPLAGKPEALRLPRSLPEALDALERSSATRTLMGDALMDLYVALKRNEHDERSAMADPRQDWDLKHLIELA